MGFGSDSLFHCELSFLSLARIIRFTCSETEGVT
jgi:hypothetical protein